MNFIKSLNPEGLQNYNPIIGTINLSDSSNYSTNEDLREVRNIIGITNSAYDFGLQAALICVNSYPEILKQTGEKNLIGYIASYERPLVTIDSGELLPNGNQFNLNFRPHKIFSNLNLVLSYLDQKKLIATIDGHKWIVTYDESNELLTPYFTDELEELKFSIQLISPWAEFSSVTVGLAPNGYPFKEVVKNLTESQSFITVCNNQGLLDSFLSSPELPYKIAIATLAVHKEQSRL